MYLDVFGHFKLYFKSSKIGFCCLKKREEVNTSPLFRFYHFMLNGSYQYCTNYLLMDTVFTCSTPSTVALI